MDRLYVQSIIFLRRTIHKQNNDKRMIKFCKEIFDVYDKYGINGHYMNKCLEPLPQWQRME